MPAAWNPVDVAVAAGADPVIGRGVAAAAAPGIGSGVAVGWLAWGELGGSEPDSERAGEGEGSLASLPAGRG